MAKPPSLYEVASREVSPVTELLKAVVEVNWHLERALSEGWGVGLCITEQGEIGVTVSRKNCWPTALSEPDAQP